MVYSPHKDTLNSEHAFPKIRCFYHNVFVLVCSCPKIKKTVCGNNGKEYANECLAKCEGVKVECNGKCPCKKGKSGSIYQTYSGRGVWAKTPALNFFIILL